jgi:hypothetical protein
MAKITLRPRVTAEVSFTVSEEEARAIDALVGYGFDGFIKVFYEKMGQHYMKPHEAGLKNFFESMREQMPSILSRTDIARRAFSTSDPTTVRHALDHVDRGEKP